MSGAKLETASAPVGGQSTGDNTIGTAGCKEVMVGSSRVGAEADTVRGDMVVSDGEVDTPADDVDDAGSSTTGVEKTESGRMVGASAGYLADASEVASDGAGATIRVSRLPEELDAFGLEALFALWGSVADAWLEDGGTRTGYVTFRESAARDAVLGSGELSVGGVVVEVSCCAGRSTPGHSETTYPTGTTGSVLEGLASASAKAMAIGMRLQS